MERPACGHKQGLLTWSLSLSHTHLLCNLVVEGTGMSLLKTLQSGRWSNLVLCDFISLDLSVLVCECMCVHVWCVRLLYVCLCVQYVCVCGVSGCVRVCVRVTQSPTNLCVLVSSINAPIVWS